MAKLVKHKACLNSIDLALRETSDDSGARAQPEPSITIYIVEHQLAHFVHLCHQPLK